MVLGATPPRSPGAAGPANHVVVRTVAATAGASAGRDAPPIGLLVVDEAYQVTFADVLSASAKAEQILLVGDPGQIGPVTTSNPAMWQGRPDAPHLRAPEVFGRRDDAVNLHLDASYRLGPDSVGGDRAAVRLPVPLRPARHRPGRAPRDRIAAGSGHRRPEPPGHARHGRGPRARPARRHPDHRRRIGGRSTRQTSRSWCPTTRRPPSYTPCFVAGTSTASPSAPPTACRAGSVQPSSRSTRSPASMGSPHTPPLPDGCA